MAKNIRVELVESTTATGKKYANVLIEYTRDDEKTYRLIIDPSVIDEVFLTDLRVTAKEGKDKQNEFRELARALKQAERPVRPQRSDEPEHRVTGKTARKAASTEVGKNPTNVGNPNPKGGRK